MVRPRGPPGPPTGELIMLWQEDDRPAEALDRSRVVDLHFAVEGRTLPVDHAHALGQAVLKRVPWLADEPEGAIHSIHLAGSQNGWERPDPSQGQELILSRRTRMWIRVPRRRAAELEQALRGHTLDVLGHSLTLGRARPYPLSDRTTLFARYVAGPGGDDEDLFLEWVAEELSRLGIEIRKALCGKRQDLDTPEGPLITRSLLVAELRPAAALRLQERGLGPHRMMGCGIFLPHKGITPVKSKDD